MKVSKKFSLMNFLKFFKTYSVELGIKLDLNKAGAFSKMFYIENINIIKKNDF